jgi:hypothetical protein
MFDETSSRQDHAHVAHYDWPATPGVDDERSRPAAEAAARDSARRSDFDRWRALRWTAAVALVCLSIAGGAIALVAVVLAATTSGDSVSIVTSIDANGDAKETVFTVLQVYLAVVAMVLMEAVLIWAALLLFARRLHRAQWVAVLVLAASTTASFAWAALAGGLDVAAVDLPYVLAFPCICAAALLELGRVRRLRVAWGRDA